MPATKKAFMEALDKNEALNIYYFHFQKGLYEFFKGTKNVIVLNSSDFYGCLRAQQILRGPLSVHGTSLQKTQAFFGQVNDAKKTDIANMVA